MIINYQMLEKLFLLLLRKTSPEFSHKVAILFLKYKIVLPKKKINNELLHTSLFGFKLKHPIGLAAGFDKNAEALSGLLKQNFSFIEVGTVTPKKQRGNTKPRVFRLKKDQSIINSLGFPNLGAEKVYQNLKKIRTLHTLGKEPIIGVNIGYNKDTKNPLQDYQFCLKKFYSVADYITINISSPNTPGLRSLQMKDKLEPLLKNISKTRELLDKKIKRKIPLALKISPDLKETDIKNISILSHKYKFAAIIATNTTLSRDFKEKNIDNKHGGASGKVLYNRSNKTQIILNKYLNKNIEVIGVGGVDSAGCVIRKFNLGANAIQLYTSLVYKGLNSVDQILFDLIIKLEEKNKKTISSFIKK